MFKNKNNLLIGFENRFRGDVKIDFCSALDVLTEEYGLSDAAYIMVEKFITLRPEEQEVIIDYVRRVAEAFTSADNE